MPGYVPSFAWYPADPKRELEKINNGLKTAEKKERDFAEQLSEIEQIDVGADLVQLRTVREPLDRRADG